MPDFDAGQKGYQVTTKAEQNGVTLYVVKELGSDMIETISSDDLYLLGYVDIPFFDKGMNKIKFENKEIIGDIEDISAMLQDISGDDSEESESEWEDDEEYEEDYYEEEEEYVDLVDEENTEEDTVEEDTTDEDEESYYSEEDEYSDIVEEEEEYYEEEEEYFEDEEDEVDSTVSKLYTYLTEEQIKILKRYYLWYSQRLFNSSQKDPTLGIKDAKRLAQKKEDLENLRNTGGLWHYAGFIDTGAKGKGFCTLGHPLRYMQLAWDVSVSDIEEAFFGDRYDNDFEALLNSNNCIIFGIKCVGDFFEVSQECIRALQAAQRDSLKDMALMYEHYANNEADAVKATFTELTKLINKIKVKDISMRLVSQDYTPILPNELTLFYLQFINAGMIPPKSLVQEIRDKLVGWSYHKFTGTINSISTKTLGYVLTTLFKTSETTKSFLMSRGINDLRSYSQLYNVFDVFFRYEICGKYKYNADTNKDEGGRSKVVKAELANLYYSANSFFEKQEYTLEAIEMLLKFLDLIPQVEEVLFADYTVPYLIKHTNSDSTVEYRKCEKCTREKENRFIFDQTTSTGMTVIDGFREKYGNDALAILSPYIKAKYKFFDTNYAISRYMRKRYETITEAYNTLSSDLQLVSDNKENILGYLNDVVDAELSVKNEELIEYNREILEKAERERAERDAMLAREAEKWADSTETQKEVEEVVANTSPTAEDVIKYLNSIDVSTISGLTFPKQVWATVSRSKSTPSEKQLKYLMQLYDAGHGIEPTEVRKDVVKLSERPDLEEAIDWLLKDENKNKVEERTSMICYSIKKYGTISERQMKYALEALAVYEQFK